MRIAATWSLAHSTASTRRPPATSPGSSGSPTRTKSAGMARPWSSIASRAPAMRALTVGAASGARREGQLAAAQLQQVLGQPVAAREIVDAHQVELAPRGEVAEVAVQQHDRDARLPQPLRQAEVHLLHPLGELHRREEDAPHLAADELLAHRLRLLDAAPLPRAGTGAAAPEQAILVRPRQARQLAADQLEDLRRPQARDQEPELPTPDPGRRARVGPAHEAPRADPPLDQPWSCRSRSARPTVGRETLNRSTSCASLGNRPDGAYFPGRDLGEELTRDLAMLGFEGHGTPVTSKRTICYSKNLAITREFVNDKSGNSVYAD